MKSIFTLITLFITSLTFAQNKPSENVYADEQKYLREFLSKIKQIKFVDANITNYGIDYMVSRGVNESRDVIAIRNFINEQLGLIFIVTPEQRNQAYSKSKSVCEIMNVDWNLGSFNSTIGEVGTYSFTIAFTFCDGKVYTFNSELDVTGLTYDISRVMKRTLNRMFTNESEVEKTELIYKLKEGEILLSEIELKKYLESNEFKNKYEGVYKIYSSINPVSIEEVAVIEKDKKIYILNLKNKYFENDSKYGEIKCNATKTSVENIYIGRFNDDYKKELDATLSFLNNNMLEIKFLNNSNTLTLIKM